MTIMAKVEQTVYPNSFLMSLSRNKGGTKATFDIGDGYITLRISPAEFNAFTELSEAGKVEFDLELTPSGDATITPTS